MTRIKTVLILLSSALIASTFVHAQDPGTYRPGQPYNAVPASNSEVCSTQCQGDAACRGWNFVRANPRQTKGICEFNSVAVDPIQSPVSISANLTQIFNSSGTSKIIPAGVRTTRIGGTKAQTKTIQSPPSGRQIIRQAVPQQTQVQSANFRHNLGTVPQSFNARPQVPQQLRRPQTHNIQPNNIIRTSNGLPPRAQQIQQPQAFTNSQADPRLQQQLIQRQSALRPQQQDVRPPQADPRLQQQLNQRQRERALTQRHTAQQPQQQAFANPQADPRLQQQFNQRQPAQPQPRLQQAPPQAQAQPQTRRGSLLEALTRPSAEIAPQQAQAPRSQPSPQPAYQARPLTVEQATQQSLYGHLNDDVSVPRQLTPEDLSASDDLPIPTVTSVPVIPIDRESFSGLAGG